MTRVPSDRQPSIQHSKHDVNSDSHHAHILHGETKSICVQNSLNSQIILTSKVGHESPQLPPQYAVTEERLANLIVEINHLFAILLIINDALNFANHLFGQIAVHRNHLCTFRFDICNENRITIHEHWFSKIKGLQ